MSKSDLQNMTERFYSADTGRAMWKKKALKLSELLQIILDPENQPPQYTLQEAWIKFLEIETGERPE